MSLLKIFHPLFFYTSLFFITSSLSTGCQKAKKTENTRSSPSTQVISYPLNSQQMIILVVQDEQIKNNEAKELAKKKAAQITLNQGYNYFIVISEEILEVTKKTKCTLQDPTIEYQELIVKNKSKSCKAEQDKSMSDQTCSAIRLAIQFFHGKPSFKKSYSAHELTPTTGNK